MSFLSLRYMVTLSVSHARACTHTHTLVFNVLAQTRGSLSRVVSLHGVKVLGTPFLPNLPEILLHNVSEVATASQDDQ